MGKQVIGFAMASAEVASSPSSIAMSNAAPKSLSKLFKPPPPETCTRCGNRVYQMEKVGPVNQVIFHKQCFKCHECGQHLTLKTYFTNQDNFGDSEIYCSKHCPRVSGHKFDGRALGMRSGQKRDTRWNEQIRGTGEAPRIDADAIFMRQPMEAQSRYQRKYITAYDKHHFPAYLVSRTKEKLYEYQEELERQHREEEDRLMAQFHQERLVEAENMQKEFDNEWEQQLKALTDQFDGAQKKKDRGSTVLTERLEEAKAELKKTMTVKMNKKKEATTLRLQNKAQRETSTLVKRHSEEMLLLLQSKQEELAKELEEEIKNAPDIEDQEEFFEVAKAALMLPSELPDAHAPRGRKRDLYHDPDVFKELDEDVFQVAESEQSTFTDLVKQLTANCISDLQKARAIFRWITVKDLNVMEFDESVKQDTPLGLLRGIKFGTETYHTLFLRLCSYAGLPCKEVTGHAKSVGYEPGMKIPEDKFTNTWNVVLIMGDWWPVQCNWGARHLVLNKDLQDKNPSSPTKKDRDKIRYQYDEHYFLTDPDEFIQEFRATDPDWQLLEHPITLEQFVALPFVRSIFFHYGLEFVEPTKAVLYTDSKGGAEVKISIPEHLCDDIIFHYQLFFADRERRTQTEFRKVQLDRFVYHSLSDGCALFSVHVPTTGDYYLEVFGNKIDASNKLGDDPNAQMAPFRLKCACKFLIVCQELMGKMHPLPHCATGEWGPTKARRHFGLEPLSHTSGLINVETVVELRLRQPRPLQYVFRLRFNDVDDSLLKRFVTHEFNGDIVSIRVTPPHVGQFGLDVFAQPLNANNKGVVAHVCKYLLNCTFVASPVEILPSNGSATTSSAGPKQSSSRTSTGPSESTDGVAAVPGPRPAFAELGLKALTHPDPVVQKLAKTGSVTIEIGHPESVKVSGRLTKVPAVQLDQHVTEKTKGKKTKFVVSLPGDGTYSFALFAAQKDKSPTNVYNYVIETREEDAKKKKK